ncbi:DMT family transporter [Serratia sp. IR-2025]|nr:multidrug transporter subunit MdtJ [Serratia marcescens]
MIYLSVFYNNKLKAWLFLVVAIIAEVVGTSFMASAARDGGYSGYVVMAISLAISYYFLALSIRSISVGVAYAIWEGLGVMLLTFVGMFIFLDGMSVQELIGLGMSIVGITCVALGEEH